jgi:hypothetical protein
VRRQSLQLKESRLRDSAGQCRIDRPSTRLEYLELDMTNKDEISSVSAANHNCLDVDNTLLHGKQFFQRRPRRPSRGERTESSFTHASRIARAALRATSYLRMENRWRRVDCSVGSLNKSGSRVSALRWKHDETTSLEVTPKTGRTFTHSRSCRVRDETIARLGVALVHVIDERAQAFL